jgi:uncharacterized RDD family membrane protein YckC
MPKVMSEHPSKLRSMFPTWRRLGAFVIDYVVILGIPLFVISIALFEITGGRVIPQIPFFVLTHASDRVIDKQEGVDQSGRKIIQLTTVRKVVHFNKWESYSIIRRTTTKVSDETSTWVETSETAIKGDDGKIYPGIVLFSDSVAFVLLFIYWIVFDASRSGASLGKRFVNIRVTDCDGKRLTISRSVVRNLLKILSILILMIGCIMIFFTRRKQGFHDLIAKTLVISYNSEDIENVAEVFD